MSSLRSYALIERIEVWPQGPAGLQMSFQSALLTEEG